MVQENLQRISRNIEKLIRDASGSIEEKGEDCIRKFRDNIFSRLDGIVQSQGRDCDGAVYTAVNSIAETAIQQYKTDIQYVLVNMARERQRTLEEVPLQSLEALDLSNVVLNSLSYNLNLSSMGHEYDRMIGNTVKVVAAVTAVVGGVAAVGGAATAYFILRSKQTSTAENREDNQHKIEELETIITSKDQELNKLLESTEKLKQKIEKQKKELSDADNLKSLLQSGDENAIATALKNEIDKLKKELQDAEDEIEDLEDESNSYKKKYNEQRSKVSEAELKIEQCENSLKELQTNLEATEEELKNTSAILDKKNEAIDFVNEILQAKDADNKDVKDINQKIRDIENFVENDLCSVFAQLKVWTQKEQQEAKNRIWQWANLQRKTWLQGKKVIAFVGEFSAGKTSIVNRILSQDNDNAPKLPVSSKATTAIATYISYGSDFNSQFTDPNGKLKNISKETFEKVNKEILQEVNVSPVITYFVMSYTNENLRDLSILDTPGFSSNDKEDAQRTADVIKEADALFWVFDANTGEINQTSLNIIREHLQDLPLYIIINKADTKSPNELEKLRKHIQSTIQKNNISVVDYILFSQKTPLNELMTTIRNVPQGNRKDEYVFNLYTDINKKLNTLNTACQTSRTKLLEAKKEVRQSYSI